MLGNSTVFLVGSLQTPTGTQFLTERYTWFDKRTCDRYSVFSDLCTLTVMNDSDVERSRASIDQHRCYNATIDQIYKHDFTSLNPNRKVLSKLHHDRLAAARVLRVSRVLFTLRCDAESDDSLAGSLLLDADMVTPSSACGRTNQQRFVM